MAIEQRLATLLDDPTILLDDFPIYPSLRIPPLQDPMPSRTSARPSPLEPNARVSSSIPHATAKLTSRRKALAEATPLGDPDPSSASQSSSQVQQEKDQSGYRGQGADPGADAPRKKHKAHGERMADFVQLPKPKSSVVEDKLPPFRPVSVLNQLHEPPPSAALFPPITPSVTLDEDKHSLNNETRQNSPSKDRKSPKWENDKLGASQKASQTKRAKLRPRVKWTSQESEQLFQGIEIYGVGKWKKILLHPGFSFHKSRTAVDLKDRHRTCCTDRVHKSTQVSSPTPNTSAETLASCSDPLSSQPGSSNPHSTSTKDTKPRRKTKQIWTEEEDTNLANGYRKHGFQWTAIAKDPAFQLAHKTGPQVRDRFRLRYPDIYEKSGGIHLALPGDDHPHHPGPSDLNAESTNKHQTRSRTSTPKPALSPHEPPAPTDDATIPTDPDLAEADLDPTPRSSSSAFTDPRAPLLPTAHGLPISAGILGLLNDDEEEGARLPSFRLDDWGPADSVTLPPLLLWEDMATRPMFDLE